MTLVARSHNGFKLCSKDLLTSIVFCSISLVGDVYMVEELFIKILKNLFQIQFKLHFGMEKQYNMEKGNLNSM